MVTDTGQSLATRGRLLSQPVCTSASETAVTADHVTQASDSCLFPTADRGC